MQDNETPDGPSDLEKIEISLLLDGIYRSYGYDFRNYALPSIRRRIWHRVRLENAGNISSLLNIVLHDRAAMERLANDLLIHVTEMFRDPLVYHAFRNKVIPVLRTYPFIRIWHAGCATGEEVYSMAILLKEEGLYDRARIYATDMNENVLQKAKEGMFPLKKMQQYTKNYMDAGGKVPFSHYYTAKYNSVIFDPALKKNILFAQHNLVTDRSFNEFNVILCRNVMIYFNKELRDQVHELIHDSLSMFGYLVLGNRESVNFSSCADHYEEIDKANKIFRKIKG